MAYEINEAALALLLEERDGPVGRFTENIAVDTTNFARRNVRNILRSSIEQGDIVAQSVNYDEDITAEGLAFVIGIEDNGDTEQYLADKAVREQPGWLEEALQEATPT